VSFKYSTSETSGLWNVLTNYLFSIYTLSQNNDTAMACYNFDIHQPILQLFEATIQHHFHNNTSM